jgi:hypothetical protein
MATNKTAYVDTTFVITVRVPVDLADLPAGVKEGDEIDNKISTSVWNKIVDTSLDVMDGPDAGNIESIVVSSIEDDDDDPDDDAMYDSCPEYVHDAAIDWLDQHATEYDDRDDAMKACKDDLAEEGYHIYKDKECEFTFFKECEWAVEDAFDDYDGEVGWE